MLIWGLVGLAVLVLTVIGIVWLARRSGASQQLADQDSPEGILRRRCAAGELDEDEYLRRRAGLEP
jgi:putative membrane protein